MSQPNDKRRSFRLNIEMPVSFKSHPELTYASLGMINEVSALGFSMTTREFLPNGSEFTALLRLPNDQRLNIPVRVVWSRQLSEEPAEYFVGVRIVEPITPETSQFIRYYVRYFLSLYVGKKPAA